jgi:SARP family transcriptional regulator, regulator of embCAB operon
MRIQICGPLRIEADGAQVDSAALPGRLGRRLWCYMVLGRRRPVGRGELVDALWGDEAPENSDASLNALASRIRSVLARLAVAGTELRASGGAYTLVLPAGTFVDRERAWTAIHHVQAVRRQGDLRAAWAEAVIANEIAARGFLAGEEGGWIENERRTLRDIEIQALEAICEVELEAMRADEAERAARRLIATDNLRESGYRLLMRALVASGNPGQATRVWEECRATLANAGASPSADTERLYRALVRSAGGARAP